METWEVIIEPGSRAVAEVLHQLSDQSLAAQGISVELREPPLTFRGADPAIIVAVIGAVFYDRLGDVPSRGSSVSAMVLAMAVDAAIVLAATGLTLLLPRRPVPRGAAAAEEPAAEFRAGAVH